MSLTDAELADLYDKYAHVVFKRCLSILRNEEDAHDAVHETFAKVLRHSDSFRNESSPLTWMYRISTNYCLNKIRNRKGRRNKLQVHREDLVGEGFSRPAEQVAFDHEVILGLLEEADDETRRVVIHTYFDDCTRQEVATLVGLSVPTVRKRLTTFIERARRKLGVTAAAVVAALVWASHLSGSLS